MIKTIKPLIISGILIAGISTASASLVDPQLMSDFENGQGVHGWIQGTAAEDVEGEDIRPFVTSEGNGNNYLKVSAFANDNGKKSGANRRMVFFNQTTWAGNFSNVSEISGDFKATSQDVDKLFLRLNFIGHDGKFYSSKDAHMLDTNDQWNNISFALNADNFYVNGDDDEFGDSGEDFKPVDAAQFAAALTEVEEFKFVSNEEYPQWSAVDVVRADLGMDNLKVSAVPLPGAVWLMVSGLLGLGLSRRKA